MIEDRFVEARRSQMRLVDREQQIRDNFRRAVGYEPSTGWHKEFCKDCDDGSYMVREGFQGEEERWVECWFCDGTGERWVADDPKWGWALQLELDGLA